MNGGRAQHPGRRVDRRQPDPQGDAQSDATDERADLTALVKTVTDTRITIQFAADAEYPYTTKASAAARKEFQLPANGPFTG